MNKVFLFSFMLINLDCSVYAMHKGEETCEIEQGLDYLNQNLAYMAPEVFETEVAPRWYKHMSFLNRYLKKSFNEADIYHDAVFFSAYGYSLAHYKMTYPQIKSLLCGGLAMLQNVKIPAADEKGPKTSLQREYLQLLQEVRTFNNSNTTYRSLWEEGKWQEIRNAIKGKK